VEGVERVKALVTGATGMVGSWLVRRLVDDGHHVVAFVLDSDPQSELIRSGTINRVNVVNGALEDLRAVEHAVTVHEVDTVFHLGAQTIVTTAHRAPLATLETNVRGTWNVLEVCRLHADQLRRVVVASSDKAYGDHVDLPYTEESSLIGRGPYDVSKSCADLIARSYAQTYDLPIGIARCGNIFGGGDLNWSRIVPGTIRALVHGEQPVLRSDGTFVRDYLHVDDVVDAYLALERGLDRADFWGQAFNFSNERPVTVREIYDAVCEAAGRPGVVPLVLDTAHHEIHDQYLSAARARRDLDWEPRVGLHDGLVQTFDWYSGFFARSAAS
jgi:CDP-glucose 4,6-dehydratase